MKRVRISFLFALLMLSLALCSSVWADPAQIAPYYSGSYSLTDLGGVGIPNPYGGLNIVAGDANTLLLGDCCCSRREWDRS